MRRFKQALPSSENIAILKQKNSWYFGTLR